jgi:hypothetical protein
MTRLDGVTGRDGVVGRDVLTEIDGTTKWYILMGMHTDLHKVRYILIISRG